MTGLPTELWERSSPPVRMPAGLNQDLQVQAILRERSPYDDFM